MDNWHFYRNKRFLSNTSRKNQVHLDPVLIHFTKDEKTFRRFYPELISADHQLINLKKVDVEIEVSIFNGFRSIICKLLQLNCARHLQQRDENEIDSFHQKNNIGLKLTKRKSFSRDSFSLQERLQM